MDQILLVMIVFSHIFNGTFNSSTIVLTFLISKPTFLVNVNQTTGNDCDGIVLGLHIYFCSFPQRRWKMRLVL